MLTPFRRAIADQRGLMSRPAASEAETASLIDAPLQKLSKVTRHDRTFLTIYQRKHPWWFDREFGLILLFLAAILLTRPFDLPISDGEARTGRIAWEGLQSGNWLVPTLQGERVPGEMPLAGWLTAMAAMVFGSVSTWSIRLPSFFALAVTVVTLYGYARQFLRPVGAFAAAACLGSMAGTLSYGRLGEPDTLAMLCFASCLMVWHGGWMNAWPDLIQWLVPYALLASAVLAIGPGAAIAVFTILGLYVLIRKQEERAISLGHLLGLLAGCVLVGMWQYNATRSASLGSIWEVYFGAMPVQAAEIRSRQFLYDTLRLPDRLLVTTYAPWSLLLLVYGFRTFRHQLGRLSGPVTFSTISLVVTVIWTWLSPDALPTSTLVSAPFVAILIGVVVERTTDRLPTADWQAVWRWFSGGTALVIATGLCGLTVWVLWRPADWPLLSAEEMLGYSLVAGLAAISVWRHRNRHDEEAIITTALVASMVALVAIGPATSLLWSPPMVNSQAMAKLNKVLPHDAPLVSFGAIDEQFLLPLERAIPQVQWPDARHPLPREVDFFVASEHHLEPLIMPFRWKQLAKIRGRNGEHLIVGRRIPDEQRAQALQQRSGRLARSGPNYITEK